MSNGMEQNDTTVIPTTDFVTPSVNVNDYLTRFNDNKLRGFALAGVTDTTDSTKSTDTTRRTSYQVTPPWNLSSTTGTPAKDVTMIVVVNGTACACIRIYSPVCGTDNKSYFNPCLLACEHQNKIPAVTVQHDGNCIPF